MKHALLALLLCAGLAQAEPAPDPAAIRAELAQRYLDAAREGRLEVLQAFIEAGYDLDTQDARGYSALILAAYHGHAEAVDALPPPAPIPPAGRPRQHRPDGAIFKAELGIAHRLMNTPAPPTSATPPGRPPPCTPRCSSAPGCWTSCAKRRRHGVEGRAGQRCRKPGAGRSVPVDSGPERAVKRVNIHALVQPDLETCSNRSLKT